MKELNQTAKFVLRPKTNIFRFRNEHQWNLIHFAVAYHLIESLEKEETSQMFSGKEVDFSRSLLDKQHEFNGTSLETNKVWQSSYLGRHTQQKFA